MTHEELRELLIQQIQTLDKISDRLTEQTCRADELLLRLERIVREAPRILAEYGINVENRKMQNYIEKRLRQMDRADAMRRKAS